MDFGRSCPLCGGDTNDVPQEAAGFASRPSMSLCRLFPTDIVWLRPVLPFVPTLRRHSTNDSPQGPVRLGVGLLEVTRIRAPK